MVLFFVLFCFPLGAFLPTGSPPPSFCFAHCVYASRVLFVFFSLAYSWGSSRTTSLRCRLMFCFVNLFEGRVPGMEYRFLACVFLCNFPNCVVTTSSLPLRLVYVSENNNNNNNNEPTFTFTAVTLSLHLTKRSCRLKRIQVYQS